MADNNSIQSAAFDYLIRRSSDLFVALLPSLEIVWANASAVRLLGPQLTGKDFNEVLAGLGGTVNLEESGSNSNGEQLITLGDPDGSHQSYYFSFLKGDETILVFGRIDADELERSRHEMFILNQELNNLSRQLHKKNADLDSALAHVKTLQGILPICMHCHKIRNDKEVWDRLEAYIERQTDAQFSHSICPDCLKTHYPDIPEDDEE